MTLFFISKFYLILYCKFTGMSDSQFLDEFYKMLRPVDAWSGEVRSIKEIFEAKLAKHGITQNQAEQLLNMQKRSLDGILDGTAKRVDVINLLKLGQFLGLETEALLKLYLNELPRDMVAELDDTRRKNYILSNFDIKNLIKAGFIKPKSDFKEIEERIVSYFNLPSIFHYSNGSYFPAFSKTKKSESSAMREFWVRTAYTFFESINNPNDFDREGLVNLLPKIRPYSMNVSHGLRTVTQALFNLGVTVIYQPKLPTTQVRGATFIIDDKPCIVLTDLNKNYATVWFALLHELHHVLYDYDKIQGQVFHLTGEPDLFLIEEAANNFAHNYFLPPERAKLVYKFIDNKLVINNLAKEGQIDPSLIYNFYCHDMEAAGRGNYWGKYKHLLPDVKIALKDINVNPFDHDRIEQTVQYLKETIFNI